MRPTETKMYSTRINPPDRGSHSAPFMPSSDWRFVSARKRVIRFDPHRQLRRVQLPPHLYRGCMRGLTFAYGSETA
jgi:hypothetical protein